MTLTDSDMETMLAADTGSDDGHDVAWGKDDDANHDVAWG